MEFGGVECGDGRVVLGGEEMYFGSGGEIKKMRGKIGKEVNMWGGLKMELVGKKKDVKVMECKVGGRGWLGLVRKVVKIKLMEVGRKVMLGVGVEKGEKKVLEVE